MALKLQSDFWIFPEKNMFEELWEDCPFKDSCKSPADCSAKTRNVILEAMKDYAPAGRVADLQAFTIVKMNTCMRAQYFKNESGNKIPVTMTG